MSSPLSCPPFVDVPGVPNIRDIGYVGDGSLVRTGLVYRSADPSKATPEGLRAMREDFGITTIFDLRSVSEIQRDGPEWAGVDVEKTDVFQAHNMTRSWQPVFASQDYSPDKIALRYKQYTRDGTIGFVTAYRDILKAGPPAYGTILKHLAQPQPSACLIHCTAGKDRTGVLVALLLMLVDVPKQQIAEEYSLTDAGLASLKPLFLERLLKNPALEGNREGIANMMSSKPANMEATVDMINSEFGGAESYMRQYCSLSDEEIRQLKTNLRSKL